MSRTTIGQPARGDNAHSIAVISALHPKADMCSALADVCFVPIADISSMPNLITQPVWGALAHARLQNFGAGKTR